MPQVTVLLARGIGIFTVVLVTAMMMRGVSVFSITVTDGPLMLVYAIISLAIGVAMIVGHNVWSGGPLPVVVTLVGWLIFLKGMALLILSPDPLSPTFGQAQYGDHFYLYLAPSLAIGLYLTWAGFKTAIRDR